MIHFFVHLVRRVLVQRQWADGTTEAMYLSDLRAAAEHPDAQVRVGIAGGLPTVQIVAPNHVPATRLGPRATPWIIVVYAPNRGRLISGHQARRPPAFAGSWRMR